MPAVAVVTGASGDVGRAVVARLAARGTHVIAADLSRDVVTHPPGVATVTLDLTDNDSVARLADVATSTVQERGGVGFGLAHCAGLAQVSRFEDSDPASWDALYRVNQHGPLLLTQQLLGCLRAGDGSVVFVGSDSARAGAGGEVVYAATKAALLGAAKSLARELARDGARINVVSPGPIDGRMAQQQTRDDPDYLARLSRGIPLRRLALPDEVAASVAWLLGEDSRYITGQTLSVSGGITMQ